MSELDYRDYDTTQELLTHLRQRAWNDQTQFVEASWNRGIIHIPTDEDSTNAICDHGPTTNQSGSQARTPKNRTVSHYQGPWRDDREWCRYCLSEHYPGVDYRHLEAWLSNTHQRTNTGVVVSTNSTPKAYHSIECSHYPSDTRAASVHERLSLEECYHCQRESMQPDPSAVESTRLRPKWRYECPDCESVRVHVLRGDTKKYGREYAADGGGAVAAERDRAAGFSCKSCGEWLHRVWDKKQERLVSGGGV